QPVRQGGRGGGRLHHGAHHRRRERTSDPRAGEADPQHGDDRSGLRGVAVRGGRHHPAGQGGRKSYGVGVIVLTHGETDCNNTGYGDSIVQLLSDYNADLPGITGQSYKIPMYMSQQHGCPGAPACTKSSDLRPTANDFEWQLAVQHPGDCVCTGPKYKYPAHSDGDGIHLTVTGYELLGEKTAQVYYQRAVLGKDWQPLM